MKILFFSLIDFKSIEEHGIYTDLLREFMKHGHEIYVISPVEKRKAEKTILRKDGNAVILKLKIGNMQKTNFIEKGVSTVTVEPLFVRAIKRYFSNIKFDLILYSTPPITFQKAVSYVKKRDGAATYLMLKDIFPQNAVDIGILQKTGFKGILYRYFRKKEKKLYAISDRIGCMSQANVDYVLKHNPEISKERVEICPNSIEPVDRSISAEGKISMRKKYGIPEDKTVFVYGGNLGRPQGIEFLIECLRTQENNPEAFFLIIGSGTEYGKIADYIKECKPRNVKLMKQLPKEDYDRMVGSCDVGMIFLDHRFTIPNFPSRLLSYMQAKLPVLAVTDPNTDIGKVIEEGGFGWWCESNDIEKFMNTIMKALEEKNEKKGELGFGYLKVEYSVEREYLMIVKDKDKV